MPEDTMNPTEIANCLKARRKAVKAVFRWIFAEYGVDKEEIFINEYDAIAAVGRRDFELDMDSEPNIVKFAEIVRCPVCRFAVSVPFKGFDTTEIIKVPPCPECGWGKANVKSTPCTCDECVSKKRTVLCLLCRRPVEREDKPPTPEWVFVCEPCRERNESMIGESQ